MGFHIMHHSVTGKGASISINTGPTFKFSSRPIFGEKILDLSFDFSGQSSGEQEMHIGVLWKGFISMRVS